MITARFIACTTLLFGVAALLSIPATSAYADSQNSNPSSYTVSAGDQLEISVLGHDELKETVTVLPDGSFEYPIAGQVQAAGLTVKSLESTLARGLSKQLNQPAVTVIPQGVDAPQVTVLGAVKQPGQYSLKSGWGVLEAIAASGGPAQDPVLTRVTVVRNDGKMNIPVDFNALMQGTGTDRDIPLKQGDLLLVEQMDPASVEVQVLGDVSKPATYYVPTTGSSILNLLTQAGGPMPNAALSQVQVIHAGQIHTIDLRSHLNDANDSIANTHLFPGDVLMIPTNTRNIAILGEVQHPATYTMPDGDILTPTEALTLAGGPTDEANERNASIVRVSSTGQLNVVPIDFNALLSGKTTGVQEPLQPGDVVYIPAKGRSSFNPLSLIGLTPLITLLK